MNWRDRLTTQISSTEIKPRIGMELEILDNVDEYDDYIGMNAVIIDIGGDDGWAHLEIKNKDGTTFEERWASDSDWDYGHFKIIKR